VLCQNEVFCSKQTIRQAVLRWVIVVKFVFRYSKCFFGRNSIYKLAMTSSFEILVCDCEQNGQCSIYSTAWDSSFRIRVHISSLEHPKLNSENSKWKIIILVYLPKIKVGLSNHQSVCLCQSVCPPLILLNRLVDFHEIWYGGNGIQGDVDAIILNPTASIILKLLRFKVVRWV
jgi:hypothetical protein